eukprot:TRINITY_DN11886_c0_g2_i1.p1 TRINITY_DN11886_c0_g2~~TRINITY_DN11886_c0_g2_i1.p1  ORF type:complete len:2526 (-),score=630.12 TRINITY_DN11886_c0_g2_i1:184-7761(-)
MGILSHVINLVLKQFLAPYCDNLDPDKINVGLGTFELKNLELTKTLFHALGFDVLDVETGGIEYFGIKVPLLGVLGGKMAVTITGVTLMAKVADNHKSDGEMLEHLRKSKALRIDKATQKYMVMKEQQALVDQAVAEGKEVKDSVGFGAKVARQLMGNFTVTIAGMRGGISDTKSASTFILSFRKAFVSNPIDRPQGPGEDSEDEGEAASGQPDSLTKKIACEGLALQGQQGAGFEHEDVIRPMDLSILFNHEHKSGNLSLKLGLSQQDTSLRCAELSVEQLRGMLLTVAGIRTVSHRLKKLLEASKELVDLSCAEQTESIHIEYVSLRQRELREELDLAQDRDALDEAAEFRLQTLKDAVAEKMQALWMVPLAQGMVVVAKEREARRKAEAARRSFFGRIKNFVTGGSAPDKEVEKVSLELGTLREDAEKLRELEPPKTSVFEIGTDLFDVALVKDEEVLLGMRIMAASFCIRLEPEKDHRGLDNALFSLLAKIVSMRITHFQEVVLSFGDEPEEFQEALESPAPGHTDEMSNSAFALMVQNRFEVDRAVLGVTLNVKPIDLTFVPSLPVELATFVYKAKQAQSEASQRHTQRLEHQPDGDDKEGEEAKGHKAASTADEARIIMADFFMKGTQWAESEHGKAVLNKTIERIPDAFEMHIQFAGPRALVPIQGLGHVWLSTGSFEVQTPGQCVPTALDICLSVADVEIAVADNAGLKYSVISPFNINGKLNIGTSFSRQSFDATLSEVNVRISPEAGRILLSMPKVLLHAIKDGKLAMRGGKDADSPTAQTVAPQQPPHESAGHSKEVVERAMEYYHKFAAEAKQRGLVPQDNTIHVAFDISAVEIVAMLSAAPIARVRGAATAVEFAIQGPHITTPLETIGGAPALAKHSGGEQKRPQSLSVSVEAFNARNGRWEPVLEPFVMTFVLKQEPDSRFIRLLGNRPCLVNMTPGFITKMAWYGRYIKEHLRPEDLDPSKPLYTGPVVGSVADASRYRFLNLSDSVMDIAFESWLEFGARSRASRSTRLQAELKPEQLQVPPSGGEWIALDRCALQSQAEYVAFKGYDNASVPLNQLHAVQLRDDEGEGNATNTPRLLAQLLRPDVTHTMLLVSTPCLIFNDTTLPVEIRFPGVKSLLSRKNCAPSSLLILDPETVHKTVAPSARRSSTTSGVGADGQASSAVTPDGHILPGEVASVPLEAITMACSGAQQEAQAEDILPHVRWEMRPAGGEWVECGSKAQEEEAHTHHGFLAMTCGPVKLLVQFEDTVSAPPAKQPMLFVRLIPAMKLVSLMPCDLSVEYKVSGQDAEPHAADLPAFGLAAAYNLRTPAVISMRVRCGHTDSRWSDWGDLEVACSKDATGGGVSKAFTIGCGASLVASVKDGTEIVFYTHTWLVDRTGWDVEVLDARGRTLPGRNGVSVPTASLAGYKLKMDAKESEDTFELPAGENESLVVACPGKRVLCARSQPVPKQDVMGYRMRCITLLPRIVLHNTTQDRVVKFRARQGGEVVTVQGAESVASPLPRGPLQFCVVPVAAADDVGDADEVWSPSFPCEEKDAGALYVRLQQEAFTLEVRPDRGVIVVLVDEGSHVSVKNEMDDNVDITLRGQDILRLAPGKTSPLAWLDPLGEDANCEVEIAVAGQAMAFDCRVAKKREITNSKGETIAVISSLLKNMLTTIFIEKVDASKQTKTMRVEIMLPRIGVSLIAERGRPAEIVFAEANLVRMCLLNEPDADVQFLDLTVADIQVDWQGKKPDLGPVLLGSRGLSHGSNLRSFFRLVAQRCRTSSPILHIKAVRAEVDEMEVGITRTVLEALKAFADDAKPQADAHTSLLEPVLKLAGTSILDTNWKLPNKQRVVNIEEMRLSPIATFTWCSLDIDSLSFIPKWTAAVMKTISFSNALELKGANVVLGGRQFTDMQGAAKDVARALGRAYLVDIVQSLSSVLGNSSLLNIPRAPLRLFSMASSTVVAGAASLASETSVMVTNVAEDDEYAERFKKQQARKKIGGISEGLTEAISDIGEGFSGIFDIVRKPLEGARQRGLGGFVKGIGLGVMSAVTKPIVAVGAAVSDVGAGMSATVGGMVTSERVLIHRRRLPRMLAGTLRAVVEYSAVDAIVGLLLAQEVVEAVVPLYYVARSTGDPVEAPEDPEAAQVRDGLVCLVLTTRAVVVLDIDPPEVAEDLVDEEPDMAMLANLKNAALGTGLTDKMQALANSMLQDLADQKRDDLGGGDRSKLWSKHQALRLLWKARYPLQDANWFDVGGMPQLEIIKADNPGPEGTAAKNFITDLPWSMDKMLPEEIHRTLQWAMKRGGASEHRDWTAALRAALSEARMACMRSHALDMNTVCIVWEVQRWSPDDTWIAPYLPNEPEQQSRWMDLALLKRHPLLDPEEDWLEVNEPPIVMSPVWVPIEDWRLLTMDDTDEHGWQYGTGWTAATWRKTPRKVFDLCRRRMWQREYALTNATEGQFIDGAWLRDKSGLDAFSRGAGDCCCGIGNCCCCLSCCCRPKAQLGTPGGRRRKPAQQRRGGGVDF